MLIPGIASVTFRSMDPRQVLELAREAGLKAVEWGGDVHVPPGNVAHARSIGELTSDVGLAAISYGSYLRVGCGDEAEPWVETARALGCSIIRVWAGNRASAVRDATQYANAVSELQRACRIAAQAGVACSLEYHENTLADTPAAVKRLLADVGDPSLRTYWQIIQPPAPATALLEQLTELRPVLSNLHVFQREPTGPGLKHLEEAAESWLALLKVVAIEAKSRGAFLEFVKDGQVEAFKRDARALVALCRRVNFESSRGAGVI